MVDAHSEGATSNDVVITHVADAPLERVWRAWTQRDALSQWWGPAGMHLSVSKLDFRPGGVFLYSLATSAATMWGKFAYQDIIGDKKIIFVNSFCDEKGKPIRNPASPTWPLEIYNILTFIEQAGKTTITIRGHPLNTTPEELATFENGKDSLQQGFAGTFAKLDAFLAKK